MGSTSKLLMLGDPAVSYVVATITIDTESHISRFKASFIPTGQVTKKKKTPIKIRLFNYASEIASSCDIVTEVSVSRRANYLLLMIISTMLMKLIMSWFHSVFTR